MSDKPKPPPPDPIDGYSPGDVRYNADSATGLDNYDPAADPAVLEAIAMQARKDVGEMVELGVVARQDAMLYEQELLDGFRNFLTGYGDPSRDKTMGGMPNGPQFVVQFITGAEARDRWRGSDLGKRIIATIPNEMTRRGWKVAVQPDDADDAKEQDLKEQAIGAIARKDWRAVEELMRQWRCDEFPAPAAAATITHTPGALPEMNDDSARIVQAIETEQRRLKLKERVREALCYKRAYGGGAVFMGLDDGETDLTRPVDLSRVKRIKHLTAYRGGWDGELIAWRYYNDPRLEKFGEVEIYMLRNIGVPIASPPAPGETNPIRAQTMPAGPVGGLIFYVHESRLLVFSEQPPDRFARVQMRGWGDSIFTQVNEVLAQFNQTWAGVSILMSEYSLPVMSMENLSAFLASKNPKDRELVQARVVNMMMSMSMAKMRLIDTKEKLERLSVPLGGVAEVLREFVGRLAAAAGMPVSMLQGQVKGALGGDDAKGDTRFFYDQLEGLQDDEMMPQIERFTQIQFRAQRGPTRGLEPRRWTARPNPLWQMNDKERAEYRKTIAETDKIYVDMQGTSPEEVVATRFGGSDYNDGPIVLDLEGRAAMKLLPPPAHADPNAPPAPDDVPPAPAPAPKPAPEPDKPKPADAPPGPIKT